MQHTPYNLIPMRYASNTKVVVDPYCNGFSVVNIGASNMEVNGVPLAPPVAPALLGESVSFGGNENEIFKGRIDISFTGAAGLCIVTQKIFITNLDR